jgi:hypothetical protein
MIKIKCLYCRNVFYFIYNNYFSTPDEFLEDFQSVTIAINAFDPAYSTHSLILSYAVIILGSIKSLLNFADDRMIAGFAANPQNRSIDNMPQQASAECKGSDLKHE